MRAAQQRDLQGARAFLSPFVAPPMASTAPPPLPEGPDGARGPPAPAPAPRPASLRECFLTVKSTRAYVSGSGADPRLALAELNERLAALGKPPVALPSRHQSTLMFCVVERYPGLRPLAWLLDVLAWPFHAAATAAAFVWDALRFASVYVRRWPRPAALLLGLALTAGTAFGTASAWPGYKGDLVFMGAYTAAAAVWSLLLAGLFGPYMGGVLLASALGIAVSMAVHLVCSTVESDAMQRSSQADDQRRRLFMHCTVAAGTSLLLLFAGAAVRDGDMHAQGLLDGTA